MLYSRALVSPRLLPLSILIWLAALPALRMVQDGGAVLSLIGMVLGVVTVAVLPGVLLAAITGVLGGRSMIEAAAVGFGVSFALVQVLTVIAILAHVPASTVLAGLWAGCLAIALWLVVFPSAERLPAALRRGEWLVLGLAIVLGITLYMQSPWEPWLNGEDAVHVAVAQRLAFEPSPSLHNIYWAPDFVYTYPFPGTHYLIALVSRAAKLDPLFVYMKIRMLWSPVALFMLFAAARVIFASERVALASALTAAALTLGGAFGPIAATWGQLAPVSHAADVAMTVLLPTLLLFAISFAAAETRRAAALFLFGTLALALTLTVVHIRETVQFVVYVGASWFIYLFVRRDSRMAYRFRVMSVATVALVLVYLKWHQFAVGHVDSIVAERREILIQSIIKMAPLELLTPIFANPYFNVNQQYYFYMWFPVILIFSPLVLIAYRSRPLVPFLGASLLAYALILFVPFVAIAFVYFTYFEILFTPVRNWLFFIYLLAGPLLLLLADGISRWRTRGVQVAGSIVSLVVLFLIYRFFEGAFKEWQGAILQNTFFLWLIAGLSIALWPWPLFERWRARLAAVPQPDWTPATVTTFAVLLVGVLGISLSWQHSPLNFRLADSKWTFRDHLAWMVDGRSSAYSQFPDPLTSTTVQLSEKERLLAAPSMELIEVGRLLPTNAVFVHNIFNRYASPVFMPQRILLWPMEDPGTVEFNSRLFPVAWGAMTRTAAALSVQPFFNEQETLEQRVAYMREVGATHVLLDPMYYARLRPLLSQWAETFEPVFDDHSRWAVFVLR